MNHAATIVIPLLRQFDNWLDHSVRSALDQTIATEVIVVRSEQTPASNLNVLDRLGRAYQNLRVLVEDIPGSFPAATNKGIRHARTDRVGLLLSDDWLEAKAVSECLDRATDIVSTGNTVYFADGRVNERASKDASIAAFCACATLQQKASYLEHFFLFRRDFVLAAGGLDESLGNFPGIDDYDLIWTLLERGATVAVIEKRLYNYRDHDGERLTLQNRDVMIRNLEKILHKHGVRGHDAERLIFEQGRWYGRPIYRVLDGEDGSGNVIIERQAPVNRVGTVAKAPSGLTFEEICVYAAHQRLRRFVLHGTRPAEYVAEQTHDGLSYRETRRPVSVAIDPHSRPRIKAPFALFGQVICTQPERVRGLFWCFDLLKSGYTFIHLLSPSGPTKISLISQLARNCFDRTGWRDRPPMTPYRRHCVRSALRRMAQHRAPSYQPSSKRILMITSTFGRGGSERQMVATASGLVARGYDVRILALGLAGPGAPTIEHEIAKLGITPEFRRDFVVSIEEESRPALDATLAASLTELPFWFSDRAGPVAMAIRHHQPAVVHCWLEMPGVIAAFAACALGVPRVVLGQRNPGEIMRAEIYDAEHVDVLRSGYPLLASNPNVVIINNSRAGAKSYERWFKLPPNTIRVLYNGFTPETVRRPAADEVARLRASFGFDGNIPLVGGLMRFVRQKDPELWLDVAAEIATTRPDVCFLLAGYGDLESSIVARIRALNLCDRVILPGVVTDIGLFYAAVDVVLLTSIVEGTPNVLIEAQAAGRPVVAPDVGGIGEAMIDGLSGRLVTERSAMRLAEAVLTVLDDAHWRRTATMHGPTFIADRFGLDRMVRETVEFYRAEPRL